MLELGALTWPTPSVLPSNQFTSANRHQAASLTSQSGQAAGDASRQSMTKGAAAPVEDEGSPLTGHSGQAAGEGTKHARNEQHHAGY